MRKRFALQWSVGFAAEAGQPPQRRVPATVPGAVQLDWAAAEGWDSWWKGDNWRQYRWMEDVYWSYQARLDFPPLKRGQRLFFVCLGVDYRFQVRHEGCLLHEQEGMFTPFEIDLTGRVTPGDILEVLIWPAAANLSIIDWSSEPKPAYDAVAASLRPVLASARIARFRWQAGEPFNPELFILNDHPEPVCAGRIEAWLELGTERRLIGGWEFSSVEANTNLTGPILQFVLPVAEAGGMEMVLVWTDHPERNSRYTLIYRAGH